MLIYRMTLTLTGLVCYLGVLLDPWLLLKEQVAMVIRRAFPDLWLIHPFLDKEALVTITHTPCNLSLRLLRHALHGTVLEEHLEVQLLQNAAAQLVNGAKYIHV